MTDPEASPNNLQVYIPEGALAPLREIEYDIRSAARLIALSTWLGSGLYEEQDDSLLDPETIDFYPIRRIRYGSPLTVAVEMLPYALSWAVSATPTILAVARGIGYLRVDYAKASELNARRDSIREEIDSSRTRRLSDEYMSQLSLFREAAQDYRRNVDPDGPEAQLVDHLVRQAMIKPELLQDSIDALWRLSGRDVSIQVIPAATPDDNDASA
jgi:hypothetical protein